MTEAEAEKQVRKWWEEEEQLPEGVKWRTLEHKGPMLAPEYERLPESVRFWYNGQVKKLSEETEECATFYGRPEGRQGSRPREVGPWPQSHQGCPVQNC